MTAERVVWHDATTQLAWSPALAIAGDIRVETLRAACQRCSLAELCLPRGLSADELTKLDRIVDRRQPVAQGCEIYHPGSPADRLYAVREGWVKAFRIDADGNEHVVGFYMPGEVFGFDGLHDGSHFCHAVPVTPQASLCELPLARLDELVAQLPALGRQIARLMSREIDGLELFHQHRDAGQAVARFLMDLSARQQRLGADGRALELAMPRRDVASFLRLTPETVSRVLRRFRDAGWIAVDGRRVRLLQPQMLSRHCRD